MFKSSYNVKMFSVNNCNVTAGGTKNEIKNKNMQKKSYKEK